jgi:L-ribulose-5-phosphate 3-epimerase
MNECIGFMQGRLSSPVDGAIQAFPWAHWRDEFVVARELGFHSMEWTLDQERLRENPLLLDPAGTSRFAAKYDVNIPSITGDCFMQAPFYKRDGRARAELLDDLQAILEAAARIGASIVVVPLVDSGRLDTLEQVENLRDGLTSLIAGLQRQKLRIAFESDFGPAQLATFIATYPEPEFGINFDIGNSASLGYDPEEEIAAYGARIVNVHVKDRRLGGTTVPLGLGNADFPRAFRALRRIGYKGNLILQTARAEDGDDARAAAKYFAMTRDWWMQAERC